MDHKVQCPYCTRRLVDRNGGWLHIKAKHPRKSRQMFAPIAEESFADISIEADIQRLIDAEFQAAS